MRTQTFRSLFVILTICLLQPSYAQENVNIGLYDGPDGTLEVRVTPDTDFDGIFSALLFSLRWERSTGAVLGAPRQEGAAQTYMPVQISGGVHEVGQYNYQIFAGFGMLRLDQVGSHWEAGKEYTIATIPVIEGQAEFELIVDAWTNARSKNGTYYVSLGGLDRTGTIVRSLAMGGTRELSVEAFPNPTQGQFLLTVEVKDAMDLEVNVVNELGAIVFSQQLHEFQGTWKQEIDLGAQAAGTYYIHARHGEKDLTRKLLIQ